MSETERLEREVERLKQWVADLQSGMYINCVYCGHRYGPRGETPVAMADVLKAHIEQCPEHPLSEAKAEIEQWQRDYQANEKQRSHLANVVVPRMQAEIDRLRQKE